MWSPHIRRACCCQGVCFQLLNSASRCRWLASHLWQYWKRRPCLRRAAQPSCVPLVQRRRRPAAQPTIYDWCCHSAWIQACRIAEGGMPVLRPWSMCKCSSASRHFRSKDSQATGTQTAIVICHKQRARVYMLSPLNVGDASSKSREHMHSCAVRTGIAQNRDCCSSGLANPHLG